MKNKIFTWPNAVTLLSLACGIAALVFALSAGGRLNLAFWFVLAAAVFDFADGLVARLTRQYSDIGVQLDSLADMVSFGVVPSAVLWVVWRDSLAIWVVPAWVSVVLGCLVFSVALASALRLAKFNVDGLQKSEFLGLPTPAAGLAVAAVGWMVYNGEIVLQQEIIVLSALIISALLLLFPLRMFSLKFDGFGWHGNEVRYLFLIAAAALVAIFHIGGIALSVALYIVVSAARHAWFLWLARLK
jgi:CDP-diacylglycerol--serine O-phosphatidyltransferase